MERDSLFESIGGTAGCRRLAEAFYGRVRMDPVLHPFFPGKTLRCAIEAFSAFLVQFLGGPPEETQHRWWLSLDESHRRFRIGPGHRAAWVRTMEQALAEMPIDDAARGALRDFFERSSAYLVNTCPAEAPGSCENPEIESIWSAQQALDRAVAAIRYGSAESALALAEGPCLQEYLDNRPAVLAALLQLMIRAGGALRQYARSRLIANPGLAAVRYSGRTLLHGAAAAGDVETVELLLRLGAAPDITDDGGHTPLYAVGNECKRAEGVEVVRALVRAGADVNARGGSKHCTALHMAARRGTVAIARALLECGADPEARDTQGVTPLQRAINCRKPHVAELLRGGKQRDQRA